MTGRHIQQIRHELRETMAQFAARLRVSPRTVEAWEQDRYRPRGLTAHALESLAEAAENKSARLYDHA